MGYGTGAIMAVPAHDERDFEFCTTYGIPIRPVIRPVDGVLDENPKAAFTEDGIVEQSGEFSGLPSAEARARMNQKAESEGFGKAAVTYRIKDWGISRQRYWGTPIPVIHCPKDGVVPVPEKDLPVILPVDVQLTGKGTVAAGGRGVVREREVSQVRRRCPPRDRHHGHVRRFVLVFLSLLRSRRTRRLRSIPRRSRTGFPSINTSAAWSTRFFT